jgi:hypothetical protein
MIRENYILVHRDTLRNFRRVHFLHIVINTIVVILILYGIVIAWHGVQELQECTSYYIAKFERAK